MKIPDYFSISLIALGLLFSINPNSNLDIIDSIFGGIIGFGFYFSASLIYFKSKKKLGLGGGDIKLIAAVGTNFGFYSVFVITFLASITSIILMLILKIKKDSKFPFGPSIVIASYFWVFIEDFVLRYF